MEIRHIKLDFDEGIASKRDILNLEIDLIYTLRRIHTYRLLRKEEILLATKLKNSFLELNDLLKNVKASFPEEYAKLKPTKKIKVLPKKEKKDDEELRIEKELIEIREKLAKLNEYH